MRRLTSTKPTTRRTRVRRFTALGVGWGTGLAVLAGVGTAAPSEAVIAAVPHSPAATTRPAENGTIYFGSTLILPPLDANQPGGQVYSVDPDGSDLRQLTRFGEQQVTGSPEVSPDGGTVAFVSTRLGGGNLTLWLMDADGRHKRQILTTPGTNYYSPSWAPDGRSLVLTSCDTALGEQDCPLVTVNADGTGLATLVSNRRVNTTPSYSPDGTRVQYASDKAGLRGAIWITRGSTSVRVTAPVLEAGFASWAPDGRHLVLNDNCCQPTSNLFTMKPDGSGLEQIVTTPDGKESISPTYSPDGVQIAYTFADHGEVGDADLVIADTDGRRRHTIVDSVTVYEPSWAPVRGTGVVGPAPSVAPQSETPSFVSTPGGPGPSPSPTTDGRILYTDAGRGVIVAMNPDGTAPVDVTSQDQGYANHATWTPDGSRIVVTVLPDDFSRQQIFSVAPDGSDYHLLLGEPEGVYDYDPIVTPNGRWVVYGKFDGGRDRGAIWAVRTDGTRAHPVTPYAGPHNPRGTYFHAVSPDGTKLAYEVEDDGGVADRIWVGSFDQRRAQLTSGCCPITTASAEAFPYSYSADGRYVLGSHFNAHLGDGGYAFPDAGGTPLRIVQPDYPSQIFEPIQSPSGTQLAYIQSVQGFDGPWDLVMADPDGSDPHVVPTTADRPIHVQWSTAATQPASTASSAAPSPASAVSRARLAGLIAGLPAGVRATIGR